MTDSDNDDKSPFDRAREFAKDHPGAATGAAIGAIGGVYGAAGGAALGAGVDEARKRWQERQNDQDDS